MGSTGNGIPPRNCARGTWGLTERRFLWFACPWLCKREGQADGPECQTISNMGRCEHSAEFVKGEAPRERVWNKGTLAPKWWKSAPQAPTIH